MTKKERAAMNKLTKMCDELSAMTIVLKTNWARFTEKGTKKGAKDARKDALIIKKMATEFRKVFKEIGL